MKHAAFATAVSCIARVSTGLVLLVIIFFLRDTNDQFYMWRSYVIESFTIVFCVPLVNLMPYPGQLCELEDWFLLLTGELQLVVVAGPAAAVTTGSFSLAWLATYYVVGQLSFLLSALC